MVHNFDSWRMRQMQAVSDACRSMHYFRIDDDCIDAITQLFQSILIARVNRGAAGNVTFCLTDGLAQCMFDFIEQVQFGYIHPRRTSAKMRFVRSQPSANPHTFNPKS